MAKNKGKNKGVVLIFTVGVLAMLVLIGMSFAISMLLDLKSSRNFENTTQARYLAEAGVNRAIGELKYGTQGCLTDAVDVGGATGETWAQNNPYTAVLSGNNGYTVTKIYDFASQIYINDTNPNLSAMLENLVGALIASGATSLAAGDGALIVTSRPASGYITKEDIIDYTGFSKAKYNEIKNYITVRAFADSDVINPLDTTTPYALSSRAPINVNTASREVLIAVLTGISSGSYNSVLQWVSSTSSYDVNGTTQGIVSFSISSAQAASLADYLISGRPYRAYYPESPPPATPDDLWTRLVAAQTANIIGDNGAALVMANANPNTDLMRCNSNYSWRSKHFLTQEYYLGRGDSPSPPWTFTGVPIAIDKTMLAVYTTEFCFNSGGYYEINSTGVVKDAAGNQISSKNLQVIVKLFDIWRQSTQAEFASGTLSHVALYPEYNYQGSGIPAANYDGQIMLGTLASPTPDATSPSPYFRLNFATNKGSNLLPDELEYADTAGGNNLNQSYPTPQYASPREASVVLPSDPNGLNSTNGTLFPDGVFFQRDDLATEGQFDPVNNVGNGVGTIEMWVKPNFNCLGAAWCGSWYYAGKVFEVKSEAWTTSDIDVYFCRDWNWYFSPTIQGGYAMEIQVRCRASTLPNLYPPWNQWDYNLTYTLYNRSPSWNPGSWHHIALTWDFPNNIGLILYVDGYNRDHQPGVLPPQISSPIPLPDPWTYVFNSSSCDLGFGHDNSYVEAGNFTMNEVRVFPTVRSAADILLDWGAGIYYSHGNAYFESSPNPIGTARLGTISWTGLIPTGLGTTNIGFDIFDGSTWIGNYATRSNPGGNSLNLPTTAGAGSSIKYRAYFLTPSVGFFDTPVLDDVTVTYSTGVKILYRRES